MSTKLKLVAEGNPHLIGMLEAYIKDCKSGTTRAVAIVSIDGDDIFSNWALTDGESVCKLLGATEVLRSRMIESMKVKHD